MRYFANLIAAHHPAILLTPRTFLCEAQKERIAVALTNDHEQAPQNVEQIMHHVEAGHDISDGAMQSG
jgi:hypothetical protein